MKLSFVKRYFIGNRELDIMECFFEGYSIFSVFDSYEDNRAVFTGGLKMCIEYCENEWKEYQESLF